MWSVKKAQSDDTKKISIDNSHAAAMDTSELVAEMMVCSQLPCVNLAQTKTLSSVSISLKPKHYWALKPRLLCTSRLKR